MASQNQSGSGHGGPGGSEAGSGTGNQPPLWDYVTKLEEKRETGGTWSYQCHYYGEIRSGIYLRVKENEFFSREGTLVAKYPNGWKRKDGLYAVGFTNRGLAGASFDATRVSQDIGKQWKEETKQMKHSPVVMAGHRRCKSHV